jgi:two-component system response regulator AtoC
MKAKTSTRHRQQTRPAEGNGLATDLSYRPRVLIADDDERVAGQLKTLLESGEQVCVDTTRDGKRALSLLRQHVYSIILTDLKMPGLDGMKLIREIAQQQIPTTVIVMTGYGSLNDAIEAMRAGAYDFIKKPIDFDHLQLVIRRVLQERTLRDEVAYLRERLGTRDTFRHIITKNPRMLSVLELVRNIAHTTTTVLIEGETGTGKEIVAQALHQASAEFRPGPLVAVNCAALPENLLESELFGHEKGAFTGAVSQRTGRFEQAHQGTLFLDEVGEIPLPMQVKLLRVLQDRRFQRVGGSESIEVDVRIVAATNRPLERLIKRGQFREDLYYRINVVRLELPPLRDRPEDIPLLASHFCEKFAQPGQPPKAIAPQAMQVLLNHSWPGNIRELENALERACITCPSQAIGPEHLPAELTRPRRSRSPFKIDLERPLPEILREVCADVESRYLSKALRKVRGNVGRCAKICGLSRRSVTAKIAEYQINKEEMKEL